MKIIIAPDSFKGSLSAKQAALCIKNAAMAVYGNSCECILMPVSDGGEGFVDICSTACEGKVITVNVSGPLGRPVDARYMILNDGSCVIEMAEAAGLTLVNPSERNPLYTSTYGVGELIKDALDKNVRRFIVGLGGSATNDAGIGALSALGAVFKDKNGNALKGCGLNLPKITGADLSGFDKRIYESEIILACDVDIPLFGETGTTLLYSPQKGATEEISHYLEAGMKHFATISPGSCEHNPGAGAAGGVAFGLMAYCGAQKVSGIDAVLDILGFESKLTDSTLVITGEGKIDFQSVQGKAVSGIGRRALAKGVSVIAFGGIVEADEECLHKMGISKAYEIRGSYSTQYAMENAAQLLEQKVREVLSRADW